MYINLQNLVIYAKIHPYGSKQITIMNIL